MPQRAFTAIQDCDPRAVRRGECWGRTEVVTARFCANMEASVTGPVCPCSHQSGLEPTCDGGRAGWCHQRLDQTVSNMPQRCHPSTTPHCSRNRHHARIQGKPFPPKQTSGGSAA